MSRHVIDKAYHTKAPPMPAAWPPHATPRLMPYHQESHIQPSSTYLILWLEAWIIDIQNTHKSIVLSISNFSLLKLEIYCQLRDDPATRWRYYMRLSLPASTANTRGLSQESFIIFIASELIWETCHDDIRSRAFLMVGFIIFHRYHALIFRLIMLESHCTFITCLSFIDYEKDSCGCYIDYSHAAAKHQTHTYFYLCPHFGCLISFLFLSYFATTIAI